ncbi:DUF2163 domain-containing protein [Shimia marina]|uniref:Bacteriophage phiJL001 Gp84 C-terminal domain-containing protein n=1 Tax=Shimia marina TaxID=321267 RepID=A0A0P1ESF2_9RHOB|nr:DUF2163 domain-containing protein [Shimia marina]CUH53464.1 hypothetical protein SHM7688_02918 [Shimia marina]SFD76348.1 phage conserved hypothetical protein BR0599 [Shimia marina]
MAVQQALLQHLQSGATTVARAWGLERRDGQRLGFTDHDADLSFEDYVFRAATGLSASALEQGTGLSVDNAEAIGLLSDAAVREEDIAAGRLDGAHITCWMVNWQNPAARSVVFRGTIGEIRRQNGAFVAELRGLAEQLNVPQGRVYQRPCTAVLGDARCRFDLNTAGFVTERAAEQVEAQRVFVFQGGAAWHGFENSWFTRGTLRVQSGAAAGLLGSIKRDWSEADGTRCLELWDALGAPVAVGDMLRMEAGCDKRFLTCQSKFLNTLNFQGFPDIPGEDWIARYPTRKGGNTGGSLR